MRTLINTTDEEAPDEERARRIDSLLFTAGSVALLGVAFLAVTHYWSLRTSYVLDDYFQCSPDTSITEIWRVYWELTGLYRPLTFPITAVRDLTCDFFWINKVFGLVLHLTVAGVLWRFGRRLGLRTPAAFAAAALFVFNPFSLEAVTWPAVVWGYPLTALFLVCFGLVLVSGQRVAPALILGFLAVMSNEQTLPLVVILPLVLSQGAWKERLRRSTLVVGPTVLLFVVVVYSGVLVGSERASSIGPSGMGAVVDNLATGAGMLVSPFPGSDLWLSFSDGGSSPIPWLGWIAVALATVVVAWGFRIERVLPTRGYWAVKIGMALGAFLLLMLPFYAQEALFLSPRYFYLPYLAISLAAGFLAEWATRKVRYADFVVLATPLLLFGVVGDGLSADAAAYRQTFEQERATAEALATTLQENPDARLLVLVENPWVFATERPMFGHHIVQTFSVGWAVGPAVGTLVGHDTEIPVLIDHYAVEVCERDGSVYLAGQPFDPSGTGAVLFSVDDRDQVGQLIVGDDRITIDDGGTELILLPCPQA